MHLCDTRAADYPFCVFPWIVLFAIYHVPHVFNGLTLSSKSPGLYWNWNKEDTVRSKRLIFKSQMHVCFVHLWRLSLSTSCIIYFFVCIPVSSRGLLIWLGCADQLVLDLPAPGGFPRCFPGSLLSGWRRFRLLGCSVYTVGLSAVVAHLSLLFRWLSWLAGPQPRCRAEEDWAR